MVRDTRLVWFKSDLRIDDNPALTAAIKTGDPVLPLFIWSPDEEGAWSPGGASRWWLHYSLESLDAELRAVGSRLVIRRGPVLETLRDMAKETSAGTVFFNRRYEPDVIKLDRTVGAALENLGLQVSAFHGNLLFDPETIKTKDGTPYRVFTPFWRACLERTAPLTAPKKKREWLSPNRWPRSLSVASLELLPKIPWDEGIRDLWTPGSSGGASRLATFLEHALFAYDRNRDRPELEGTSRLSPHLHFGEIGPRRIWYDVEKQIRHAKRDEAKAAEAYMRQLIWREFAHYLLVHFPHTSERPLRAEFESFPWRSDSKNLKAWQRGMTGYPLVDAGMRELWTTGWMHNRVRMVVASFLVKDLLIPWQEGARWFWDTLVDADLANNTFGWQWTAGCGADAAPFFRVFNPVSQGEKFDPEGAYVRRWVPEIQKLPGKWIHRPWEAPEAILADAGIRLGKTYPRPVVNHAKARVRALEALESMKTKGKRRR